MIDGKNFFDQPVKNEMRINDEIPKIATCGGVGHTTGCLLDYSYFKNYYKRIAKDLSKQEAFDTDPKAIQQINFTGNLNIRVGATIFLFIEKAKEIILDFFISKCESIIILFLF